MKAIRKDVYLWAFSLLGYFQFWWDFVCLGVLFVWGFGGDFVVLCLCLFLKFILLGLWVLILVLGGWGGGFIFLCMFRNHQTS